jgi:hypothetical protein
MLASLLMGLFSHLRQVGGLGEDYGIPPLLRCDLSIKIYALSGSVHNMTGEYHESAF